jgi:hypothetical protein
LAYFLIMTGSAELVFSSVTVDRLIALRRR